MCRPENDLQHLKRMSNADPKFHSLAFHGSHRSDPGEFALVRTESMICFHGSIWSLVRVIFYQSHIDCPRNTVYRSADYSCLFPK